RPSHGAEMLDAVYQEAARGFGQRRFNQEGPGEAYRRLATPTADELAVLDHLGEIAFMLLPGPKRRHEARGRRVHVQGHRGRGAAPGDPFDDVRVGEGIDLQAAVGL